MICISLTFLAGVYTILESNNALAVIYEWKSGRDRVWHDYIRSELDKAVREEGGRVRVAQKVFSSTVVDNVLPVAVDRAVPLWGGPRVAKVAQL